jgi:hypothetical protein
MATTTATALATLHTTPRLQREGTRTTGRLMTRKTTIKETTGEMCRATVMARVVLMGTGREEATKIVEYGVKILMFGYLL